MTNLLVESNIIRNISCLLKPGTRSSWKLLGQEKDGSLLISWVTTSKGKERTTIGLYFHENNSLEVLFKFEFLVNVIQASVNTNKTSLLFVTKNTLPEETSEEFEKFEYKLHIVTVSRRSNECIPVVIQTQNNKQIMAQFLSKSKKSGNDKFLVFIHHKSITLYQVLNETNPEEPAHKAPSHSIVEEIVKAFSWAQWDVENQSLFYIHFRKSTSRVEGEENEEEENQSPTLSALQFNVDTPHETVLNIPLNLPLPILESQCNTYEDNPIPLRVHDCTLNVSVLTDKRGLVCICLHYLYQPVKAPLVNNVMDETATVHLAYSVTLLHHGMVVHCTIPGIPWLLASQLRPLFSLYEGDHMVVYCPGLFLHLLDVGPGHEPCCHIILPHDSLPNDQWVVLKNTKGVTLVSPMSLDLAHFKIDTKLLIKAYCDPVGGLTNKLAILHYFLVHQNDFETVTELLLPIAEDCLKSNVHKIFHEVLVGGAYASVLRSLPSDALPFLRFLPLTTVNSSSIEVKCNGHVMTISQEALWNSAAILLSPRQRLCPLRVDLWSKLWELITSSADTARFKPTTVVSKLMVSLDCYQPEALSRCSTPLSPGSGFAGSTALADMATVANGRTKPQLPFYEVEKCTASKQEHIISVNLRELSMHLVKHGRENQMQVHAVATRHAAAQLEMSRFLCSTLTRSAGISTVYNKGFPLLNELSETKRLVLFTILEKFTLAVDALAYPLPQGFSSFFTYLAYCTLHFDTFIQYVQANVLQLQIDVMKVVLADLDNWSDGVKQKLRLLLLLPRSRAKRLLNQWGHPASLMIRAREHSANILSGLETRSHTHRTKTHSNAGLSTFYSADRISPLDTFLDLLTAKASLAELDFNLLVEATMSSTKDFYE